MFSYFFTPNVNIIAFVDKKSQLGQENLWKIIYKYNNIKLLIYKQ